LSQANSQQVIQQEHDYVVQSYVRPDFVLTHGEGMMLYDADGRGYQDWVAGIAVNALGYNDAGVRQAMENQLHTGLIHVSNLYHTTPHASLAQTLVEKSFADRAFFCNSGAEANEGALKFARRVAYNRQQANSDAPSKTQVVTFTRAFHGRTLGALSLTPKEKYQKPFAPLMPDVVVANFNDIASAEEAINVRTAAVIVEPIQGEGGIHPAKPEFLQALRRLCDEHDAILIFDEVQCGVGRTGTLWAHEPSGVMPDIMTLAKPLAAGLPIGAILVTEQVASAIQPGDHGSTFAGGALVTHVAHHVVERIAQPEFLQHVTQTGDYLMERLAEINSPHIVEVRGRGLMCAMELDVEVSALIQNAYDKGLLLVNAGANTVRFVPPLIATNEDVDNLINQLTLLLKEMDA
jgi:acetylornithine/N-succinyldiaminopimelate aminotransferase